MDDLHYLYLITRDDGSTYIGVTNNIKNRMSQHKTGHGSSELKNREFNYEILEKGSKDYIYSLEELKIKELSPSLNKAPGGYGGSYIKGSEHWNTSLTDQTVLDIKEELLINRNISYKCLSTKYNTTESVIEQIASNKTWKHIGPIIPPRYVMSKDTELQEKVRKLWCEDGKTNEEIGNILGVHKSTVSRITKNLGPKNRITKNNIPEDIASLIIELRTKKALSYSQISEEIGVSEHTIGYFCRSNNLEVPKDIPRGKRSHIGRDKIDAIVSEYSKIPKFSHVSRVTNLSIPTIKKYLRQEGVI
jgi:predicted GIY-YIG superfamily endonuclease/DNA-binding CsgD family transcriptional regulator